MQVLVTGVGGFIGSHVARRLVTEGYSVVGIDDFSNGSPDNVPKDIDFIEGDLENQKTLEKIHGDCAYILHLAGQSSGEISFDNPADDLEKNTVTTLNLIRYSIAHNTRKLIYASSMSVYGDMPDEPVSENENCKPLSCYGVGKLAAEGYLRVYSKQLPYVALRMFNVYGPGQDMDNLRQGMVSIYLSQALHNKKIHVKGSLERYRDFIYIDDVVEAWYRAMINDNASNLILNLGTGRKTTVQELLNVMKIQLPDISWFSEGSTPGDQIGIVAETTALLKMLQMREFVSLEEGMRKFIPWAKEHAVT